MLKETNDMRRLMNLPLLKEEMESAGKEDKKASGDLDEMKNYGDHQERDEFDDRESEVIGVDSDIDKQRLQKEGEESLPTMKEMKKCVSEGMSKKAVCEKYGGCDQEKLKEMYDSCKSMNEEDTLKEATMEEKNKYCQKHFKCDYKDCTDKQKAQCDENCGKAMNEDSEGEETYNYGEDEGHDHMEEMSMEDHIKAIEDHLGHLKKDMSFDEDHEDRDEKGTHFAEGKRYSKVLNTLTESEYNRLRKYVSNGKKYNKILNTLTESEIKKLKKFIK
tara:strand:+ start:839 stop:1663 length:825 start_codon:yes stop_codon:yes gene_type:complete